MQITILFTDPLFLIVIVWILAALAAAIWVRRPRTKVAKVKGPLMKQIGKMIGETEKGNKLSVPAVRTRQEIITRMFESKMDAIGLEPSKDGGYIPVSSTPLARFLKERGVPDDTINAILAGLMEEERETEVRAIIDAAADSPEINLVGNELDKAKDLAVEEWKNLRASGNA
jgi:hypothetical protein